LSLIANECPQNDFLNAFLHFQVFTENLEHPEYPPLKGATSARARIIFGAPN